MNTKTLNNEVDIVFLANPENYTYWREREVECGTRGQSPPLRNRRHLGALCAYAVLDKAAPNEGDDNQRAFTRRVWTLKPYDLDYPGDDKQECEYPEGSGIHPCEAVDPKSIRPGRESRRPASIPPKTAASGRILPHCGGYGP